MLCRRLTGWLVVLTMVCAGALGTELTPTVRGPGYIWWEGEHAVESSFVAERDFLAVGNEGALSGDDWLMADVGADAPDDMEAVWRVRVPEGGAYELWARVGYRPWTGNLWRVDDGEWQLSGVNTSFTEMVHMAQWRPASWVHFGRVDLGAGVHTVGVRMVPTEGTVLQGFDCLALSRGPFISRGRFRPDEVVPVDELAPDAAAEGWWAFGPAWRGGRTCGLDLSPMNDPVGSHGFVRMRDGELEFLDGTPVRFWGVNVSFHQGHGIFMTHGEADAFADEMARLGVNLLRLHVLHNVNSLIDPNYDDTQRIDEDKRDRLEYLAAALNKRGIYVNLDLMYHRMFKEGDQIDRELWDDSDPDYNVNWAAGSAALFHPRAIELNRKLYRDVLTHVNPYTGMRWVDNPGVAMVTVQNEQSILWGTTNVHRGRVRELLNQLYTQWLRRKYGSHDALAAAWQLAGQPSPLEHEEDLDTGLIQLGSVAGQSGPAVRKRGLDQIRFLYHVESGFYRDTIAAMREWGVKVPIVTSNWMGSGPTTRLVIQASRLGELVDRHRYSGDAALLADVGSGTVGAAFEQQAGRAFGISEWNAGRWGTRVPEVVPLMATLGAAQGWDALTQFCADSVTWNGSGIDQGHLALYPVAAMIYRRGDVRRAPVVFERRRDPEFQFSFRPDAPPVPRELIAIGRVQNAYVAEPTDDLVREDLIERCWDRDAGVVRAATGDYVWHYADDWMRLNTARSQGAWGALKDREIVCDDVALQTPNAFCAVVACSLDGRPIRAADHVVVAAVGRTGALPLPQPDPPMEARDGAQPPRLMEPVRGTVRVHTRLGRVYALDALGYRVGEVAARRDGDVLVFAMEGAPQVVYYEITD